MEPFFVKKSFFGLSFSLFFSFSTNRPHTDTHPSTTTTTMSRVGVFAVVAVLLATLCLVQGAEHITLSYDAIEYHDGPFTSSIYNIYVNEAMDVFLVWADEGTYSYNYNRSLTWSYTEQGGWTQDYSLAESLGEVVWADGNTIYKAQIKDIDNYESYSIDDDPEWYYLAVHRDTYTAYLVNDGYSHVQVFNLSSMSVIGSFDVTEGVDLLFLGESAGAYVPAIDQRRNLLWLSSWCDDPTPGQVWQYHIADPTNPTLRRHTFISTGLCNMAGFVDEKSGRAWFWEDAANMILGYDVDDLSWGSKWSVPTVEWLDDDYAAGFGYDSVRHQAFWIDQTANGPDGTRWRGGVYRHCLLNEGPNNVKEVAQPLWSGTASRNAKAVYFDVHSRNLYFSDNTNNIYAAAVDSATDCAQEYSAASTLSSFFLTFLSFLFF